MKKKRSTPQRIRDKIKNFGTLNIILIIVFGFFIIFHLQMLQLYKTFGSLPESYAIAVVGATIGEAGICGWIRTTKDRQRQRRWDQEDEKTKRDPPGDPEDERHNYNGEG